MFTGQFGLFWLILDFERINCGNLVVDINYMCSSVWFWVNGTKEAATIGLILSRHIVLSNYGDALH